MYKAATTPATVSATLEHKKQDKKQKIKGFFDSSKKRNSKDPGVVVGHLGINTPM